MSAIERARDLFRDPNPIVRKELLAVLRTPLYVRAVVVALIALALLVVSTAIAVSDESDATQAGRVLFQIFYGGTFVVMSLVGPTFGATSIVHERETRTLDALALSFLGPRRIVTGKLVAVFAAMAFIPLVSVPMLGVVLLFGGVTIGHLLVTTFYVLLLGAVGVAFGVAVSARSATTRRAVAATVPLALLVTLVLGSFLGAIGHDYSRHHALSFEGPFFFADAYFAVPFDREYLFSLVCLPAYVIGVPLWLFYAVAYGGLMEPTEDSALPLKRWTVGMCVATLAICAAGVRLLGASSNGREILALLVIVGLSLVAMALFFAFAGDALRVTRRMKVEEPGALARMFMPPTLVPSIWFVLASVGLAILVTPPVLGAFNPGVMLGSLWALAYLAAMGGLMGVLAVRQPVGGSTASRIYGAVFLFVTFIGVWLVAALMGALSSPFRHPSMILALSPFWAAGAVGDAYVGHASGVSDHQDVTTAMAVGAGIWAVIGAVLLIAMTRLRPSEPTNRAAP